ncbi:MAG: thioredoxin family protein [Bacteroidota bacterium]
MKKLLFSFLFVISFHFIWAQEDVIVIEKIHQYESFESFIKTGVTLVFFHASHCSACEMQMPAIEMLALNREMLSIVRIATIDFDEDKALFDKLNINSFPLIVIYKEGKEQSSLSGGGHSQQELVNLILDQH